MDQTNATPPRGEMLTGPDGQPLGQLVAPRPGPVVGRASGTVYLNRQPRPPIRPQADLRYAGRR
jgi:hypothetical protein